MAVVRNACKRFGATPDQCVHLPSGAHRNTNLLDRAFLHAGAPSTTSFGVRASKLLRQVQNKRPGIHIWSTPVEDRGLGISDKSLDRDSERPLPRIAAPWIPKRNPEIETAQMGAE